MIEPSNIYEAVNLSVCSLVPSSADRILDIGCGNGALGRRLRQDRERQVIGITYSRREAELASNSLSQVICADLNEFDFSPLGKFDCVIMSHVLEHLYSPESLLQGIKCALALHSTIVVALPNVLFWRQRLEFLRGNWRYQDGGILDRTHLRFFDIESSRKLVEQLGYKVIRSRHDGAFPLTRPVRKLVGGFANSVDDFACRHFPGLFAFQSVYLAELVN